MKIDVEKLQQLTGHQDAIYALYHQSQTDKFYSSGGDGMIVEWDFNSFPDGTLIAKVPNSVYSLFVLEDNLYIGHNYDGIHLITPSSKEETSSIHLGKEAIFASEILNNHLLVGLSNGEFIVLQKDDLKLVKRQNIGENRIRKIIHHKNFIYLACSDHKIYTLNSNYEVIQKWKAHDNSVTGLAAYNDTLISVGRDAKIKFWDLKDENKLGLQIPAHNYAINDISISPDKKYFATCSIDKTIKIWSTENRKLLKVVDKQRHAGHGTSVNKVFWKSADCFVSCSDDRTISVWKIKERQ